MGSETHVGRWARPGHQTLVFVLYQHRETLEVSEDGQDVTVKTVSGKVSEVQQASVACPVGQTLSHQTSHCPAGGAHLLARGTLVRARHCPGLCTCRGVSAHRAWPRPEWLFYREPHCVGGGN